jgi:hypothetical protein
MSALFVVKSEALMEAAKEECQNYEIKLKELSNASIVTPEDDGNSEKEREMEALHEKVAGAFKTNNPLQGVISVQKTVASVNTYKVLACLVHLPMVTCSM